MRHLFLCVAILSACLGSITVSQAQEDFAPAMEAYREGRFGEALKLAKPLAEKGNVAAQLMLGSIYNNGEGVAPDTDEAARWLAKAADQGARHDA